MTGIIGVPGDRDNTVIEHAARVAARGFNRVIVKEDHDLRGRAPGEVSGLLCNTVREVSPAMDCQVVMDEVEALRQAVGEMIKGEVIVLFYEKLRPIERVLDEFAAQPVPVLPPLAVKQATSKSLSRLFRSMFTKRGSRTITIHRRALSP
ncbi:MAG TPA: hypothetical protein VFM63_00045 [Pyrinomonadaceae bacterium]|nr:hypothetical protein [Pyrinomonadaceae bacterium]